jgi:hypothetical protein
MGIMSVSPVVTSTSRTKSVGLTSTSFPPRRDSALVAKAEPDRRNECDARHIDDDAGLSAGQSRQRQRDDVGACNVEPANQPDLGGGAAVVGNRDLHRISLGDRANTIIRQFSNA